MPEKKKKVQFTIANSKESKKESSKWIETKYSPKWNQYFIQNLLPQAYDKQVKRLKEIVKENEKRNKLVRVTIGEVEGLFHITPLFNVPLLPLVVASAVVLPEPSSRL